MNYKKSPQGLDMPVFEVTLIRRSTGVEIQVKGDIPNDHNHTDADDMAELMLYFAELVGDSAGYRSKRDSPDVDKAQRQAWAINKAKAKARLRSSDEA